MKKYGHSASSIFLMEIIINILLFSVLLTISLQVIIKAHTLTEDTAQLHRAVTACANIASCFESGDGTLDSILTYYTMGSSTGDRLLIYFDAAFTACKKSDAVYVVSVGYAGDSSTEAWGSHLTEITISCSGDNGTIYSVNACHYEPLTTNDRIGGVAE
jgi:hypothetical protein